MAKILPMKAKDQNFLVMPNGTVSAESLTGEVCSPGNKSMIKIYQIISIMTSAGALVETPAPKFYYRGYENSTSEDLEKGRWYVIDPKEIAW